ncbi:MAG: ribosome-associated translation inhibitor RaiA [Acidobacteriota bacterium]
MNIEFVGRHMTVDDGVRQFAAKKLEKLDKFLQEPVDVKVTLGVEKRRKLAEIHVAHRLGVLQATEATDDMKEAIQMAADKVEKQARRGLSRLKDRRKRGPAPPPGSWPLDVVEVQEDNRPRVIRSTNLVIKPMGVEEAVLQLDSGKNDFLVFRELDSEQVQVIYKRKDGNYGLIAPEF